MSGVAVDIKVLPHGAGLPLPSYGTEQAAAADLYAAISNDITLQPGQRFGVPTGIAMTIPAGYEAQIRARSGLALKHGIGLVNGPATIDADYRGELLVILVNWGQESFTVTRGMRIAQMVIAPCYRFEWQQTESLSEAARNTGGFGSTGL